MFDLSPQALLQKGLYVIILLLSLSVHEFAHAWSAFRLGDDTAQRMGRLTLDPFAHADPIGTFLLPLLGVPFGWAKPVPVNPARFRRGVRMGTGMALTAAAGPIANVLLTLVAAIVLGVLAQVAPGTVAPDAPALQFLLQIMFMNIGLALFNLLPVPPLDGSRIVDGFLPTRYRPAWESITAMSPFLLLAVLVLVSQTRLLRGPMHFFFEVMLGISRAIALA